MVPYDFSPQLLTSTSKPPVGYAWIHEPKLDGYRLIAVKKGKDVHLFTRQHNDWTHRFKSIARAIAKLNIKELVLDGEVIVQNEQGLPDFQQLQDSLDGIRRKPYKYYVFDLLLHNGKDLRGLPLIKRKEQLKKISTQFDYTHLAYCQHYQIDGQAFLQKVKTLGLEGMVSKLGTSIYAGKRTKDWLKTKCQRTSEFLVCGYTHADASYLSFGSLFLGKYVNGKLVYCGNVGTGFRQKNMPIILNKLRDYEISHCPFERKPPDCSKAVWLEPKIIAEISYSNITADNILRHPSFKTLREDKMPTKDNDAALEGKKEKEYRTFSLRHSHSKKYIYPTIGISKQELIEYYQNVEKYISPYIENRLLNLYRIPQDTQEDFYSFYQRYLVTSVPKGIKTLPIITQRAKHHDFFYINSHAGYVLLPKLDAIEIHTWSSKITNIDFPDFIVFDIDPGTGVKWQKVVAASFHVKDIFDSLQLKSYVKTTGSKGLHVVIPLKPKLNWNETLLFSKSIVRYLCDNYPRLYTNESRLDKRHNKIYIDVLRNNKCATAVAPYSIRARPNAPVATPLYWDELSACYEDTHYTIKTIFNRLEMHPDPWKDLISNYQELNLAP